MKTVYPFVLALGFSWGALRLWVKDALLNRGVSEVLGTYPALIVLSVLVVVAGGAVLKLYRVTGWKALGIYVFSSKGRAALTLGLLVLGSLLADLALPLIPLDVSFILVMSALAAGVGALLAKHIDWNRENLAR